MSHPIVSSDQHRLGPPKTDWPSRTVLTKPGPLEKGMANHFSLLALRTPWTVWKGKKIWHWKMNSPGSIGAQHASGEEWRNNSRKNEEMEPKQKQHPVVDVTGDGSKVWCCKEKYCIGTWMLGPWIKVNWKRLTGEGKSEHQHFRIQRTKMDWNGWI